jgi:hypothetical protein
MKKISFALLLGLLSLAAFPQNNKEKLVIPPNYQVDTRIDNMGYWNRMAELGLVPVQPMYKPARAVFTGTRVFTNKGVLVSDSPDVPVTTNSNTESENSIVVESGVKDHVLNSNNSTPQPSSGSTYGADWYNSFDGGTTWNGSYNGAGGNNDGDPAACINLNGRYFVGYINSGGHQSVAYSDNHGSNWTTVVACAAGSSFNILDKNHLWVDISPTSPNKGNVYDAWMHTDSQIHVCRSITNGTSYEADISISAGTAAGSHNQGVNIKCGPDGEAYCAWAVYDSWPSDEKAIGFSKSLDGGVTWTTASRIINNLKGIRTSGVTQNMRCNSFPSMACDLSNGPHRGDLYIVWTNIGVPGVNTGSSGDVYMIKSTDKGDTWSTPIQINQNAPDGKDHYLPWITCDQANGYLSVVFYDSRNVAANQAETYLAYSTNGGSTWTDMKVSDVAFTPAPIPNMATGYMGDYLGITAYDGRVYPTWTDNRLGYCMTYVSPVNLVVPMGFVGVAADVLNDTTFGNGNGKMDFGETELLTLTMQNTGTAPADSVTVTVTPLSPYITMIDSTEFYGDFAIGTSRTIQNGFKFHVSDSIPHGLSVQFLVKAKDKIDSIWTTSIYIVSHAPAVTIISTAVNDPAPGGNGNGRLDPGETVTLNILTQNTGDYNAVNAISDLFKNNPYVSIANPSQAIGTLIPGQQVTVPFTVTVNPSAAIGSAVRFRNYAHAVTQNDTKIWTEKIGLIVEDWETGDFTKFAWQFPDTPWLISDSVTWEKVYCARSGVLAPTGGISTLTLHYNALIDDSISFHRRINSQPFTDKMKFYIDSSMVGQWSGNQPLWNYSAFPVLAGPHTFKWEFQKTGSTNTSKFASWLDFIVFPPEYKTTVNTGGNATVCAGSSYQLNGMAFSYDSLLWTTSGSGVFSDPKILNPLYSPSPADITAGSVNLTLTAYSALTHDTANSMTLLIVAPPVANAGGAQDICAGSTYTASSSSASNYATLAWATNGTGSFDDATALHPVYTPSSTDIAAGQVYLKLSLTPITAGCPVTSDSLLLSINALPSVQLGADTAICADKHIILDPKVTDATAYLWHPSGATTPTLSVDSTGTGLGFTNISVDVTNAKNCVGSGTIRITFKDCSGIGELKNVSFRMYPNPNNGIFTVEFNAGQKEMLDIDVMNASGVTVYSLNSFTVSGFVTKTMDLGTLPQGTYLFRISNGKESTLRKLVIKK